MLSCGKKVCRMIIIEKRGKGWIDELRRMMDNGCRGY